MARPRSEGEPLDQTFSFKLTATDKAAWESKIARSGYTKSEFFRQAVRNNKTVVAPALRPQVPRKVVSKADRKTTFLLAQISNNINQCAKRLNYDHRAGIIKAETYATILSALLSIAEQAKKLGEN